MLRFPRALWLALALATLLAAPTLWAALYCDDQIAVLRLDGVIPSPKPGAFDLYTFASGAPDDPSRASFPWWSLPDLRLRFFRPLSSALLALDHTLAGRSAPAYHLHTMAWYVAAVAAAIALLRQAVSERTAALAGLLFAIMPIHWMASAWPSARHVAIAGALGFGAIGLHVAGRRAGSWLARGGALGLAGLALLASESGLGVLAFVAAYELVGATDARRTRLVAMAPWAVLFAAYAVVYRVGGYGVYGAGGYVDPVREPLVFALDLPIRLGVLAAGGLVSIPSEISLLAPAARPVLAGIGAIALASLILVGRVALRAADAETARGVRWLALGAALAVLPGAAGLAGDRVLFLPSVGTAAAFAVVLLHAGRPAGLAARAARGTVALLHVVLAAPIFLAGVTHFTTSSRKAVAAAIEAELPARAGTQLFGIGLADPLVGMYLGPALLLWHRGPLPRSLDLLTMSPYVHVLRRTGPSTVEITLEGGRLLDPAFEGVVRHPRWPLRVGDVIQRQGFRVTVLATDEGRPTRFAFEHDLSLDDPGVGFVCWRDGKIRPLAMPREGETLRLAHEPGPMGM